METFQAHILAADRTFYEGPCLSMTIPTSDGELGILPHHSAMIAAVQPGTLRFQPQDQPVQLERPEEIDAVRAQREADQAREALLQKKSRQEHQIAQATLARALNRLRVKGLGS